MRKHATAALGAVVFALSYTLRRGMPWNNAGDDFGDLIWKVPEGSVAVAVALLPLLVTLFAARIASVSERGTGLDRLATQRVVAALADGVLWSAALLVWWIVPSPAHLILGFVFWCGLRALATLIGNAQAAGVDLSARVEAIAVLFFFSGVAALIYQIVWQRTLFAMFGVDIESVTIIVSVFMFGLGVGAVAGTLLLRFNRHLLPLFVLFETGIGLFGWFSLPIAGRLQSWAGNGDPAVLVIAVYALFALPTLLMGATLPVLLGYLNLRCRNIGSATGLLYASNTWGSALAAMLTVTVIFVLTGLQSATRIAATINFVTALAALRLAPRLMHIPEAVTSSTRPPAKKFSFAAALALAFVIGFLVLSQELVWFRLLGFVTGGDPRLFGMMLSVILLGIGFGSFHVKQAFERADRPGSVAARLLFVASALSFLALPVIALASVISSRAFGAIVGIALCGAVAYCTGGILPLLATMGGGAEPRDEAARAGWIYAANIAGASSGPLVTGYALLNAVPLEQCAALFAMGYACLAPTFATRRMRAFAAMTLLLAGIAALYGVVNEGALERVQAGRLSAQPFAHRIENRSGVITVEHAPGGDVIYGGGVYDGGINTDPVGDSNGIRRVYMIASLHPQPREILEIGLSGGSWAAVLSSFEVLQRLTSVEINPGYLTLAGAYPETAPILQHPNLQIAVDDGRRWLRRHPDRQYDVILMNTTFHWRANVTNLLSREFLETCRRHLRPGGVFYFNTTGSEDAMFTAAQVFRHVFLNGNFAAASDTPFRMTSEERRTNLLRFKSGDGEPVLLKTPAHRLVLQELSIRPLADSGADLRARTDLRVITDDNMLTEFKL